MLIVEEHVLQGQPEILAKCVQLARYSPWHSREIFSLHQAEQGHVPECQECKAGRYSTEGADECRNCPADTFSKAGWSECFDCPVGKTPLEDYASTGCRSSNVWLIAFFILCPFTVVACCIAGSVTMYRQMQARKFNRSPGREATGEAAPVGRMGRSESPEEI